MHATKNPVKISKIFAINLLNCFAGTIQSIFEHIHSVIFFQVFFSQLRESFFYLIVHPHFKIYVSYIYIYLFILHRYITISQNDQLPVRLITQFVEHCINIAEVISSNPVQASIFYFRLSCRNCLSFVVTARIFLLFESLLSGVKSNIISDMLQKLEYSARH